MATTSCIQSASAVSQIRPASHAAIAPWWHTLVLIALFLIMAAGGAMLQSQAGSRASLVQAKPNLSRLYLSMIAGEWALVYYVWKVGLRRTGTTIGELIGGKWASPRAALLDVLFAGGLWALWKGAYFLWSTWFGTGHVSSVSRLMPQGVTESTLWVLLSISAGISEELVFRGYFQRQFLAWTGRVSVAVLLQVTVFGVAHGYQGVQSCLAIAAYGTLFTLLALYRKSLLPGILAHAWTDIAGGLLR